MTQVDFYVGTTTVFDTVLQICHKALQRNMKVRILTSSAEESRNLDRFLWERHQLTFIPHCRIGDPLQAETPIWISEALSHEGEAEVLINLQHEVPPFFAQFLRLAEVVGEQEEMKQAGRERYRFYQQRGYPLNVHNLTGRVQ